MKLFIAMQGRPIYFKKLNFWNIKKKMQQNVQLRLYDEIILDGFRTCPKLCPPTLGQKRSVNLGVTAVKIVYI